MGGYPESCLARDRKHDHRGQSVSSGAKRNSPWAPVHTWQYPFGGEYSTDSFKTDDLLKSLCLVMDYFAEEETEA